MASKNKTYIQKTIDNIFKRYTDGKINYDELKGQLYGAILGNESEYVTQIEERLQSVSDKSNARQVKVRILGRVPKLTAMIREPLCEGNAKANIARVATVVAAATAMSISLVACNVNNESQKAPESVIFTRNIENQKIPVFEPSLELEESEDLEKDDLETFATAIVDNTANSMNAILANGVRMVDFEKLTEDQQKDLIAGMGLQYYLVANIDDITTLEYANFMQEQSGTVLDNNALIYSFRNMNVLLKQQMLVCLPDNKIDFSNIYQSELDAKLLNDGADILARLNSASGTDRKNISKEFYDYVQSTLLDNTDKLQYSNSALSTFINSEFGAWTELTKSSGYKTGYRPDDELEAKVMTLVGNCGMSSGEKEDLNIHDETKTSAESVALINVLSTLDSRKENIPNLIATEMLHYDENISYGNLKKLVIEKLDLTNYHEIESYEDKMTVKILSTKPQIHSNDSRVSNGQGGTIANSQLQEYGINPSDPNARQQLEQKVQENYNEVIVDKNSNGEVIDRSQAASWAQQGAVDASNGTKNNNVPSSYQEAYDNGWNAANSAKQEAEKNITNSTTFEEVTNGSTTETITDETYNDFTEPAKTPEPSIPGTTVAPTIPDVTPAPSDKVAATPAPSNTVEATPAPDTTIVNGDIETTITFVPVTEEETTETIIEEPAETIIEETVVGFADTASAPREIKVGTLTREDKIQTYKDIKDLIQMISNSFDNTLNIYDEMENHMSK